jgi:hypothetical protein
MRALERDRKQQRRADGSVRSAPGLLNPPGKKQGRRDQCGALRTYGGG